MYVSQEMPNLRRFLAHFGLSDNQMTIILEIILFIMSLGPEKNEEILFTCVVLVIHLTGTIHPHVMLVPIGSVFFRDQNRSLICLKHMIVIKILMQIIIKD